MGSKLADLEDENRELQLDVEESLSGVDVFPPENKSGWSF